MAIKLTKNLIALLLISALFPALNAGAITVIEGSEVYASLRLSAEQAIIVAQDSGEVLYAKNADVQKPIASITKLMTAMVVLDANLPPDEMLTVTGADIDRLRNSGSRLAVGSAHTREVFLHLALMSSENRATSALSRHYPGGFPAFMAAMNKRARELGMTETYFADATGLDARNVSTARDLVRLVQASFRYSLIRKLTTSQSYWLQQSNILQYKNSNPLFKDQSWEIGLSKTGYINPAGRCLVMQIEIMDRPLIVVLLGAPERQAILADSGKVREWAGDTVLAGQLPVIASDDMSTTVGDALPPTVSSEVPATASDAISTILVNEVMVE